MPTTLLSNGVPTTVLSTSSAGAVTGTTFALPTSFPQSVAWTTTGDGSAISTTLETSNDGSSWSSADSASSSGTKTVTTSAKFIRANQVSRTGGTLSNISITTSRSAGGSAVVPTTLSLANGTTSAPSLSWISDNDTGWSFNPTGSGSGGGIATYSINGTGRFAYSDEAGIATLIRVPGQLFNIIPNSITVLDTFTLQDRWSVAPSGHILPATTNNFDIGSTSAKPRSIYVGTSFLAPDGSAATPSLSFAANTDRGIYNDTTNSGISFSVGGAKQTLIQANAFRLVTDTSVLSFGSASDVRIGRVGVGQLNMGTGAILPVINGTLTVNTTQTSTGANTTETDLFNYSLPAGALNANGRGIRITAWGFYGANANVKNVKMYFGAQQIGGQSGGTFNNLGWRLTGEVFRTGAATQISNGTYLTSGTGCLLNSNTPTETLSGAVTIRVTGQNGTASAGDITGVGFFVETIN